MCTCYQSMFIKPKRPLQRFRSQFFYDDLNVSETKQSWKSTQVKFGRRENCLLNWVSHGLLFQHSKGPFFDNLSTPTPFFARPADCLCGLNSYLIFCGSHIGHLNDLYCFYGDLHSGLHAITDLHTVIISVLRNLKVLF